MSTNNSATIEVIVREDEDSNTSRGTAEIVSKAIDLDHLRGRFSDFMSKLQTIVEIGTTAASAFQLEEVEFSAELTANGEFKLFGTGVGIEASSAIKFVLRRRPAVEADK